MNKNNIKVGYLSQLWLFISHKYTMRLIWLLVLLIGWLEYSAYKDLKQLSQVYANRFSDIATAAALKRSTDGNYCIIAPSFQQRTTGLILNDFSEIDIEEVLKQAIYFHLGWPNKVRTQVGQRTPHFELYANGVHYLWSFSTQDFYEYRLQQGVMDQYLALICQDLAGQATDRRTAYQQYSNDPKWQKLLARLILENKSR